MKRILDFLVLLLAAGAASPQSFPSLPQRLPASVVLELEDSLAQQIWEFDIVPEFVDQLNLLDPHLEPVFYIPGKEPNKRIWYELKMNRWFRLHWSGDETPEEAAAMLVPGKGLLQFIVTEYQVACRIPNDYNNYNMWGLTAMELPDAWDLQTGDEEVIISVIDTGCRIDHPDLAGNIRINPGEDINHNGVWDNPDNNNIDDDHNGFIDDVMGWDFVNQDPFVLFRLAGEDYTPRDNQIYPDIVGHGTHTAGIAASVTDNNIGVPSASWNVTSMPIRAGCGIDFFGIVLGIGDPADFAPAMQYAADNGTHIISISFGSTMGDALYQTAINYVYALGVLVFAAAGNENSNIITYPAGYPHVIAVAAIGPNDVRADFSNYGNWVDLASPGVSIWSTLPNNDLNPGDYGAFDGTSMSTPNAAAVAALILSVNPQMDVDELEDVLLEGCDNIDGINPGYAGQLGAGRINAYESLLLAGANAPPTPPYELQGILYPNGRLEIWWEHDLENGFLSYIIYRDYLQLGTSVDPFYVDMLPALGTYIYTVTALYEDGETDPSEPFNVVWEILGLLHFEPVPATGRPYAIIVESATLDDVPLSIGDEIGIFDGDLCVGAEVINGVYPLPTVAWQGDIAQGLPGFTPGDQIRYRIWIYDEEIEYPATAEYFQGNGTFGYGVFSRITLRSSAGLSMTLPLAGRYFELISTCYVPTHLAANLVFGNVQHLAIVYQVDGGIYVPPIINTIGEIDVTQGYQVYCTAASEITFEGALIDPLTNYTLAARRWNWLGYPFDFEVPVNVALAPIEDVISIVMNDEGHLWIPRLINTLGNLTPGEGYYVFVTQDITFQYDQAAR